MPHTSVIESVALLVTTSFKDLSAFIGEEALHDDEKFEEAIKYPRQATHLLPNLEFGV